MKILVTGAGGFIGNNLRVAEDYTSENTDRLDVAGMKQLLMKLDFIRNLVAGRPAVPVD